MLHGCTIGDNSLIGIGAVILNKAKIGKNCIIGAKALITEGMEVPDGSMVLGVPAKIKKELTLEEQAIPSLNAHHYIENYKKYKAELGLADWLLEISWWADIKCLLQIMQCLLNHFLAMKGMFYQLERSQLLQLNIQQHP